MQLGVQRELVLGERIIEWVLLRLLLEVVWMSSN